MKLNPFQYPSYVDSVSFEHVKSAKCSIVIDGAMTPRELRELATLALEMADWCDRQNDVLCEKSGLTLGNEKS